VIKIWDYDVATDKVIPGSSKIIVDGGVDLREKPIWIEAPISIRRTAVIPDVCRGRHRRMAQ
jgi:alpha-N-arabinofuranosidase